MTILQLKTQMAAYLGGPGAEVTLADFTVGGEDLALTALNHARMMAEMDNEFNFQRKRLTLNVNTVTGADLDDAVIEGTATTVRLKRIVDIGLFDVDGNLVPQEWTTTEEGLGRVRRENRRGLIGSRGDRLWRSDDEPSGLRGLSRFVLANDRITPFPLATVSETLAVGIEAYVFSPDWTTNSNTIAVTGGTGVTGVNATYYRYGLFNGHPLFISLANGGSPGTLYFLWHDTTKWVINTLPGTVGSNYHSLTTTSQSPAGSYTGHGTFTGTAVAVSSESDTSSDIWTTYGSEYLLWSAVAALNNRFKFYVPRTEGNLAPPKDRAMEALARFIEWDVSMFEQSRRHSR